VRVPFRRSRLLRPAGRAAQRKTADAPYGFEVSYWRDSDATGRAGFAPRQIVQYDATSISDVQGYQRYIDREDYAQQRDEHKSDFLQYDFCRIVPFDIEFRRAAANGILRRLLFAAARPKPAGIFEFHDLAPKNGDGSPDGGFRI
jgi:hypothetical protein